MGTRTGLVIRTILRFATLLTALAACPGAQAQDLPRGRVVPRVSCAADPGFSYALYLPKAYAPDRNWPVMFCFDPEGAGERPVHLLESAAERYGIVLMGSWNARNGPLEPIRAAQDALWKEARSRYTAGGRCYATGFSGGARAAVRMALDHPKDFDGVLCCGALLPGDKSLGKSLPFAVYATVGNEDFNLFELYQADRDLGKGGTPHWIEIFAGPHRWAPPELLGEGVEFLRVCALRKGQVPADEGWMKDLVASRLASAEALEASGALLPALWKTRQTAAFFEGVPGVDRAAASAARLAGDARVKTLLDTEEKLEKALDRLRHCQDLDEYEREFASLEKLAQGDGYGPARARWALTVAGVDLSTTGLMELQRGNAKSAAALFELATRAAPKDPLPAYNAACAYARLNQREPSLALLGKALDRGFKNAKLLREDPDLASVRKDPRFAAVLARIEPPPVH